MSADSRDVVPQPAPGAAPTSEPSRAADALWSAGLVLAVFGLLLASFGGAGVLARMVGLLACGLAGGGLVITFQARRKPSVGALLAVCAALFTAFVGGRPSELETILLSDAPRFEASVLAGVPDGGGSAGLAAAGPLYRPGPVALYAAGLPPLKFRGLLPQTLVAAEWDGAWYAGRVLSVEAKGARVHFIGWESEWDQLVPSTNLRGLDQSRVPQVPRVTNQIGSTTPVPGAMLVSVYQPVQPLPAGVSMSSLTPTVTLYAQRLDVSDAPIGSALQGIAPSRPFGLTVKATLRVDAAGPHHFGLAAHGLTKLWVDGKQVNLNAPLNLAGGLHDLRLEHWQRESAKLTLRLSMGKDPKKLSVLDMNRNGVAQAAREPDGSLRLVLAEGILFDYDQDALNASAERALNAVFDGSPGAGAAGAIKVEGHTDDRGSDDYNLGLSRRRAESVRTWLVAHGREASSIVGEGFGEKRPRVPNDTEAHRHANRRVELVFSSLAGSARNAKPAPAGSGVAGVAGAADASGSANPVEQVLQAYYRDLNAGSFDADRYFESRVSRYITMRNTSTQAMNSYIRNVFPKQFKEAHFDMEPGSLVREPNGEYVYVERSSYTVARSNKKLEQRVKVRIQLSAGGKLVSLHQFEKLPRR